MSNYIDVCALNDINLDTGVCALINDQQVAIFRPAASGTVFAISNFDPIGKANVLSRGLISDIKGRLTVASPLYKQHYCLDTGECLEDETVSVTAYPTKVEGNRVLVAV
ncbi:nitrite reductase small subunit NirD [Oceaniserpentilla sp. 4NH20-0058]|uniref:nitrite reductase small subunit NirD n=1 Tax=Oceaniserpentilla sp. 4NH20-0058 TaxID=3127660 RepID=UPI00310A2F06